MTQRLGGISGSDRVIDLPDRLALPTGHDVSNQ